MNGRVISSAKWKSSIEDEAATREKTGSTATKLCEIIQHGRSGNLRNGRGIEKFTRLFDNMDCTRLIETLCYQKASAMRSPHSPIAEVAGSSRPAKGNPPYKSPESASRVSFGRECRASFLYLASAPVPSSEEPRTIGF
jgi:hypothetical protein